MTSPSWGTVCGVRVGVGENHALRGELVNVRCLVKVRPHVSSIFPSEIIEVDKQDIRLGFRVTRGAEIINPTKIIQALIEVLSDR